MSSGPVRTLFYLRSFYVVTNFLVVFSALRAYALMRNMPVSATVFVISAAPAGLNLVRHYFCAGCSTRLMISNVQFRFGFDMRGVILPVVGCAAIDNTSAALITK